MTVPTSSGTALLCLNGPQAGLMVGMADVAPSGYVLEGPDVRTFYLPGRLMVSRTLSYPPRYVFKGAAA